MDRDPLFIIVDLFCGFGGTTAGFHLSELNAHRIAEVIACVNHDPKAIRSHWLNNPRVKHFNEDIRTLDLTELIDLVLWYRRKYPQAKLILWASLECTNFSKAKGGRSRNADSRTLANHLERYVKGLNPEFIMIENVVEFMSWGPLIIKVTKSKEGFLTCPVKLVKDKNGRMHVVRPLVPESRKNGQYWMKWRKRICNLGYRDEWRQLNSANFGAYTSRNRLFGIFAKAGETIAWPEPTHAKRPEGKTVNKLYRQPSLFPEYDQIHALQKWLPVKDVLNFTDQGKTIFHRKKPLSEATLERIYAGLIKFIAGGDASFLSKYYSGVPARKNIPVTGPSGALTTIDHHSFVQTEKLGEETLAVSTGAGTAPDGVGASPMIAIPQGTPAAISDFLMHHYSNGDQISSNLTACPTVTTRDGAALIQTEHFIEKQYTKSIGQSIEDPAGALMPIDKNRLLTTVPLQTTKKGVKKPPKGQRSLPKTGSGLLHFLINPSWGGNPGSIEEPCCVIVARQDKAPLYFVHAEKGNLAIAIYETDSPATIRIKQFMAAFGLIDVKMRMLRVSELLRIQGFPDTYKMVGNQGDQKKFIGNSVVPQVVKAWAEALGEKSRARKLATAA